MFDIDIANPDSLRTARPNGNGRSRPRAVSSNGHNTLRGVPEGRGAQLEGPVGYERHDVYADGITDLLSVHARGILHGVGEDPEREGLLKTPERVAKAMQFLTHGYRLDPEAILSKALFEEDYSEMILVKDIEVFSLCEHHMLPFFGKAHVAYIPNGKIVGLSKIPRVVDAYARRLQVQERLTMQIRDAIQDVLKPRGVAVVIEATHLCMVMRGVQKQHSSTVTSAVSGEFLHDVTRAEFMRLIPGATGRG